MDPVGKTITINGQPFLVVGWYERKDLENWPGTGRMLPSLPYTFSRTLNQNSAINSFVVRPEAPRPRVESLLPLDAFPQLHI